MSIRENNKKKLVEIFEKKLPDFAQMIKATANEKIVFHQDAFAVEYQEDEFALLGMAIKYAGIHNREITIVPTPNT